jgi:hypothetical protein
MEAPSQQRSRVVHVCNPSYLEVMDGLPLLNAARAKTARIYLKNKAQRPGSIAQAKAH